MEKDSNTHHTEYGKLTIAEEVVVSADDDDPVDSFYADKDEIIRVFDMDHAALRRHYALVQAIVFFLIFFVIYSNTRAHHGPLISVPNALWSALSLFVFYTVEKKKRAIGGLHLALATKGVRQDMIHVPFGSGFHIAQTIPYNEIKAIQCKKGQLTNCYIVSIRSNKDNTNLNIFGIANAQAFVNAVQEQMNSVTPVEWEEEACAALV